MPSDVQDATARVRQWLTQPGKMGDGARAAEDRDEDHAGHRWGGGPDIEIDSSGTTSEASPQRKRGPHRRRQAHGTQGHTTRGNVQVRQDWRWVATLNVGTLGGRLDITLDWMKEEGIRLLAVQEHQVHEDTQQTFQRQAGMAGYKIFWGDPDYDIRGRPTRGWRSSRT